MRIKQIPEPILKRWCQREVPAQIRMGEVEVLTKKKGPHDRGEVGPKQPMPAVFQTPAYIGASPGIINAPQDDPINLPIAHLADGAGRCVKIEGMEV